jgi:ribosomal protein L40E
MPQETMGFVRLEWVCPHCNARNPGPQKTCSGCGAAQPADVAFEQALQETEVTDARELTRAQSAPDIHCGYCGARNPADATTCTQCGAGLGEGRARAAGRVVGARQTEPAAPVKCPFCGESNPAAAQKCAKCGGALARPEPAAKPAEVKSGCSPVLLVIFAVIVAAVVFGIFLATRTSDQIGSVGQVGWTRTIAVLDLQPVTRETWRTDIPSGARIGQCVQRAHHTQDSPAANSRKVCGTPYIVDRGTGYGQVVQDCVYEVLADWCQYSVNEWRVVSTLRTSGQDLAPRWPASQLTGSQRLGDREETYEVRFVVNDKSYTYTTQDAAEFARYRIGSRWALQISALGAVVAIEPAQ